MAFVWILLKLADEDAEQISTLVFYLTGIDGGFIGGFSTKPLKAMPYPDFDLYSSTRVVGSYRNYCIRPINSLSMYSSAYLPRAYLESLYQ